MRYNSLGTVYLNTGDKAKALESYKAAARLGDKDAVDWLKKEGVILEK